LHEDEAIIAIDKPPNMPSAPTRVSAAGTALEILRRQLGRAAGSPARLSLVHRLDVPTSGVLLFARCQKAAAVLARAFRERRVEKEYAAVVEGSPVGDSGRIALPIGRRGRQSAVESTGKPAVTEWQVLRRGPKATLVRLLPRSGRTHQLRVHMEAIGHPIVGDRIYGGPAAPRLMLHAKALRFAHPTDGQRIEVTSPVPPEFT
jgi:RluA family pseudouridine synthase